MTDQIMSCMGSSQGGPPVVFKSVGWGHSLCWDPQLKAMGPERKLFHLSQSLVSHL